MVGIEEVIEIKNNIASEENFSLKGMMILLMEKEFNEIRNTDSYLMIIKRSQQKHGHHLSDCSNELHQELHVKKIEDAILTYQIIYNIIQEEGVNIKSIPELYKKSKDMLALI